MIHGLIFDLDGTLVDSGLDFDLMRREMGLPPKEPILEALAALSEPQRSHCWTILHRHELQGAQRATLMPGVTELIEALADRGIRRAVFTRNGHQATLVTLNRVRLSFDTVVAREDAPAKPDPTGIWRICESWELRPEQVAMVGDYRFDIEAGRRAGARTVCYAAGRGLDEIEAWGACHSVECFSRPGDFLAWLADPR